MPELHSNIRILDPWRHCYFILDELIGEGSFGEVWRAHNEAAPSTQVAIKFYIPLDEAGRQVFFEEYRTSENLNHSNLLTSLFYGEWNRRPYIGMPFCERGASSQYVGTLSPCAEDERLIWRFVHDVAAGLDYLHNSVGLVHQDIKPDNILIDSEGCFVITDFGISREARATLRAQSQRSNTAGAPAYMAPERFARTPPVIYASDIWSLGVSIHELATGELPFNGMGGGLQNAGAEMPVLGKGWSKDLNTVMQLCLSKEPWDRKHAGDLREYATWVLGGKQGPSPFENQRKEGDKKPPRGNSRQDGQLVVRFYLNFIIAGVVCLLFSVIFGDYVFSPRQKKYIGLQYPNYRSMVERCKDLILSADNENIAPLFASQLLLDSITRCEKNVLYYLSDVDHEEGTMYDPERYTESDNLTQYLRTKQGNASDAWADLGKQKYDETRNYALAISYVDTALQLFRTEYALSVQDYLQSQIGYMKINNVTLTISEDGYSTYLLPQIHYDGIASESKKVTLYTKIINPEGKICADTTVYNPRYTSRYAYEETKTISPGPSQILNLKRWELQKKWNRSWYRFELYCNGNKIYSGRVTPTVEHE